MLQSGVGGVFMWFLWALIVGLIVGALAKLIMPGKDPGGIIVTMLLGVAGAVTANLIGHLAGWYQANEAPGIIASTLGAILILGIYRLAVGRRFTTRGEHPV